MNGMAKQFGTLAEFVDAAELVSASARAYEAGYRRMECYSPLPVEGLAEAIQLVFTARECRWSC
jgi:hypothetical protein